MAYFSGVRQLLRNRRFDIVSQKSNEDGRKHTHTHTGIYSSFYDASSIQIYTPGWREAL